MPEGDDQGDEEEARSSGWEVGRSTQGLCVAAWSRLARPLPGQTGRGPTRDVDAAGNQRTGGVDYDRGIRENVLNQVTARISQLQQKTR